MAAGALTCVKPGPDHTGGDGSVTFYTLPSNQVHCSFPVAGMNPDVITHVSTGSGQLFGAMNTAEYAGAAVCGSCVEVTRDGSRKVTVTIVDECPSSSNDVCVAGHIDLSRAAFLMIGTESEGFLGTGNSRLPRRPVGGTISWRYVACPVTGNAFARVKSGNQNELFIENLVTAVKSVSRNGTAATLQNYGAWHWSSDITAGASFTATDFDNSTINFTLNNVSMNADQDTGQKFQTCQ
jgi:hypothetical protein